MIASESHGGNANLVTRWLGPSAILLVGAIDTWWTWRKWPDVLLDFGRELYVAWQLASGKILYTDVAYFKGPLSPYLNAFWFRLFGVSVTTLIVCNLLILSVVVWLFYQILLLISNRSTATIGCITFLVLFAFPQFIGFGNYNFVCPYSHESTHGIALSLLGIWCLRIYLSRHGLLSIAGAGIMLGLAFLTTAEISLAAFLAMAAGLGLLLWQEQPGVGRSIRIVGLFAGCAVIPPVIALALLCFKMPPSQAFVGVLGSWTSVFSGKVISLKFYRDVTGTSNITASVEAILRWLGLYILVFGLAAAVACALPRRSAGWPWLLPAVFVIVAGVLAASWQSTAWLSAARPLPVLLIVIGTASLVQFVKKRRDAQQSAPLIIRLTVLVYAFALLGKVILNVHVYHYGFALAMPATLITIAALLCWAPAAIDHRGGNGSLFRAATLAVLTVAIVAHLEVQQSYLRWKTHPVSPGADLILSDPRGEMVNAALSAITSHIQSNQTLTVLPEGVMLNYLSRRTSSVPLMNFMPLEFALYGEDRILESFRARPPNYIALVHKDTSEYGFRFFGRDYGQTLWAWVQKNYHPVALIGDPPLRDEKFGILLVGRNQP
jgi:hypothetical protein